MRFFKLNDGGSAGRQRPWTVDPAWDSAVDVRLHSCHPIEAWDESLAVIKCPATNHYPDMPFSTDGNLLVADRLREFFESEAPGAAQYLPLRLTGPGAKGCPHRYWAMNILTALDCMDKARSLREYEADPDDPEDEPCGPSVEDLVINPSKVPDHVRLGRVVGFMVVALAREDLCEKLEEEGFIGPLFSGVWHSTDPEAPPPIWKPGVRLPW